MDFEAALRHLQAEFGALQARTTTAEHRVGVLEALAAHLQQPNNVVRTRPQVPPKFAGNKDRNADSDALLTWEFDMQAHLEYARITDPGEQLRLGVTQLEGPAKLCWRNHVANTTDPATGQPTAARCQNLTQLVERILRPEFLSANHVQAARNELSQCFQAGSVTDYVYRFRQICLRIPGLALDEKLHRFLEGLKDHIRYQLALNPPADFEAACAAAERIAAAKRTSFHRTSDRAVSPAWSDRSEAETTPMEINSLRDRAPARPSRSGVNSLYRDNSRTNARNNSPAPSVRFATPPSTSSSQHSASGRYDTPRTVRFNSLTPEEKEELTAKRACFYCRKIGHTSSECRAKMRKQNAQNAQ